MVPLLWLIPALAAAAPSCPLDAASPGEWRRIEQRLGAAAAGEALKRCSVRTILAAGDRAVAHLGLYRVRLSKRERVRGTVLPEQVLDLLVRERPFAVRLTVLEGPSKGRVVVYNPGVRKGQMEVREAGALGWAGPVWISISGMLAFQDTSHPITDLGYGAVLKKVRADFDGAEPLGGYARVDEGWDELHHWCMRFVAPRGGEQLYAQSARICIDPLTALPTSVENADHQGFHERIRFSGLDTHPAEGARALLPAGGHF